MVSQEFESVQGIYSLNRLCKMAAHEGEYPRLDDLQAESCLRAWQEDGDQKALLRLMVDKARLVRDVVSGYVTRQKDDKDDIHAAALAGAVGGMQAHYRAEEKKGNLDTYSGNGARWGAGALFGTRTEKLVYKAESEAVNTAREENGGELSLAQEISVLKKAREQNLDVGDQSALLDADWVAAFTYHARRGQAVLPMSSMEDSLATHNMDWVADGTDIVSDIAAAMQTEAVRREMERILTAKELSVVHLAFGFDGAPQEKKDIAEAVGENVHEVDRLKKSALRKLRHSPVMRDVFKEGDIQTNGQHRVSYADDLQNARNLEAEIT